MSNECYVPSYPDAPSLVDVGEMFRKHNYRVVAHVAGPDDSFSPHVVDLDTGAGPNLVAREWLTPAMQRAVIAFKSPSLTAATKHRLEIKGVIQLTIRLGDLTVPVWFVVAESFAVSLLLGTAFVDRYVRRIDPISRTVTPQDSRPVQIEPVPPHEQKRLLTAVTDSLDADLPDDWPLFPPDRTADPNDHVVRVTRRVTLAPNSETPVLVRCPTVQGLALLRSHPRLSRSRGVLMANGVMNIAAKESFYVNVANLEDQPVTLTRNTRIGVANCDIPHVLPLDSPVEDEASPILTSSVQSERSATPPHDHIDDPATDKTT